MLLLPDICKTWKFSFHIISIDYMTQVSDQVRNCLENMSEKDVTVLGFADIDNFKSVNDTYGHEAGDFWIREIAAALREMRGSSDIACRYGGDEYILFLQNIGDLGELTERVRGFKERFTIMQQKESRMCIVVLDFIR